MSTPLPSRRLRGAVWPLLPLVLSACSGLGVQSEGEPAEAPSIVPEVAPATAPPSVSLTPAPESRRLSIAAVGDLMLGTDFPQPRLHPEGAAGLLAAATPTIASVDVAFGNLEGVLLDGGEPVKRCSNPSRCYLFRSPSAYASDLAEAGFDALSLANNHARDFGEEGRSASMKALASVGIRHSGRVGDVAAWEVNGLKVALIAFAPFGGSNDMLDSAGAVEAVQRLDADNDLVLVSMHAGAEGRDAMHLPFAEEHYYGENRGDVVAFARAVVDAGADLVVGHGPHVPRAMELYQGRLIAYSLGNFATYQGFNIRGENGLAPLLVAELDGHGEFLSGRIHSFQQQRPQGTLLDSRARAARLIARLSAEDFPDGELLIDEQGHLKRRPPATAPPIDSRATH